MSRVLQSSLSEILGHFEEHPVRTGRELREALQRDPHQFLEELLQMPELDVRHRGVRYSLILLLNNDVLVPAITDSRLTSPGQAGRLMSAMLALDAGFMNTLMRTFPLRSDLRRPDRMLRLLDLVAQYPSSLRDWRSVARMHRDSDGPVRAKCALLIARFCLTDEAGLLRFRSAAPRIRANIVETLIDSDVKDNPILSVAIEDSNHRVVSNACLALYAAGDTRALLRLESMIESVDSAEKLSALWALGKCRDGRFAAHLRTMLHCGVPEFEKAAAATLAELEVIPAPEADPSRPADDVDITAVSAPAGDGAGAPGVETWVDVTACDGEFLMLARPIDFIPWSTSGFPIDYTVEEVHHEDEDLALGVVYPVASSAITEALNAIPPPNSQRWTLVAYGANNDGRTVVPAGLPAAATIAAAGAVEAAWSLLKIETGITDQHIVMIVDESSEAARGAELLHAACSAKGIRLHWWYLPSRYSISDPSSPGLVRSEGDVARSWPAFVRALQSRYVIRTKEALTAISLRRAVAGGASFPSCTVRIIGARNG